MKILIKTILTGTLILFYIFSSFAQQNIKQSFLNKSSSQGFIENKGQIIDQNNKPNDAVAYLFIGKGLNVQLRKTGFSYDVWKKEKTTTPGKIFSKNIEPKQGTFPSRKDDNTEYTYSFNRIDIEFENATNNFFIYPEQASDDYTNYYTTGTPEQGVTMVKNYQKVTYKNVWNGINIEFELVDNKPKYNIILKPGAKISDIKLRINGADNIDETNTGLLFTTRIAAITETIPYSFISKGNINKNISTHFIKLEKDLFTITTDEIIPNDATLTIDPKPALLWSTYYGGSDDDLAMGMTTDKNENLIITGRTSSTSKIATSGSYNSTLNGAIDVFIVNFSLSGKRKWGTYYGNTENDVGYQVSNDTSDNIYIAGYTESKAGISTTNAHQISLAGGKDGFVAKFDKNGSRIWSTYYGGTDDDYCTSIAVSPDNFLVISGTTRSSNGIASSGGYQTSGGGGYYDAYLAKFNLSGTRQWATYYGGSDMDMGWAVSLASKGYIYLSGATYSSSGIASSGAYQSTFGGGEDGYLVKFDTSGTRVWATYFGGGGIDQLGALNVNNDTIYIAGSTESSSGIATSGAFQTSLNSKTDAFFAKLNSSGSLVMGTYFGGNDFDLASSIYVDKFGCAYVSGCTYSSSGIATSGTYSTTLRGTVDGMIIKFNKSGGRDWCTYFGGDDMDFIEGSASKFSNNFYFTGYTASGSGFPLNGAYQSIYGGGAFDVFVASFLITVVPIQNNTITNSQNICFSKAPLMIQGSTPSGGIGTYAYRWLKSSTGNRSDYSIASGAPYSLNYYPPTLSSTTWYKRVVVSDTMRDTSTAVLMKVFPKPKVSFLINNDSQCRHGNYFIYTDSSSISSGSISYKLWTFGDGQTSFASNPVKSYDSSGNYYVKLVLASDFGCKDSLTKIVNIHYQPKTRFGINNNAQCLKGNVFMFYDSSSIKSGTLKRFWDFGDSTNSIFNPSFRIYERAKTFKVKLINTSDYGCTDTLSKSITVNPQPGAQVSTTSGIHEICQKDSLELKANTGSSLTYKWLKNDTAIINSNIIKILVKKTGNYKAIVTNGTLCSDTSGSYQVTVNPIPVIGIISGTKVITSLASPVNYSITPQSGHTYLWSVTGGNITSGQNTNSILVQWTKNKTGRVKVELTNSTNCSDTAGMDINITVSIKYILADDAIKIYPNPNKGSFTVTVENPKSNMSIVVYNLLGEVVKTVETSSLKSTYSVDLNVANGLYLVKVTNGGLTTIQKAAINK